MEPRVIMYYQTFTSLKPILLTQIPVTHIHLSSIHFGYDAKNNPYIHLNNDSPYSYTFDNVWTEIQQATKLGIKVKLMVGGAGGGYASLFQEFNTFYPMLADLFRNKPFLSGIDLDIEESVSLNNVKMLMSQIKEDFGNSLTLSMAPIQSSLESDEPGMGGFTYKDLLQSPEGKLIDYFNVQFYSDYSCEAFDRIVDNGYLPEMIVMGAIAGTSTGAEVTKTVQKYKKKFGGVFVWEYCFAKPSPLEWAKNMHTIISKNTDCDKIGVECPKLFYFLNDWLKKD